MSEILVSSTLIMSDQVSASETRLDEGTAIAPSPCQWWEHSLGFSFLCQNHPGFHRAVPGATAQERPSLQGGHRCPAGEDEHRQEELPDRKDQGQCSHHCEWLQTRILPSIAHRVLPWPKGPGHTLKNKRLCWESAFVGA